MKLLSLILVFFLFSCSSNKDLSEETKAAKDRQQTLVEELSPSEMVVVELSPPKSRESIKIEGRILSIDELNEGFASDQPCGKVACTANIRVDQLKMINRFFDESFSSGDELKAYFMFTLSETTEELFPVLGVRYPGLEEGDRFEARIKIGSPIEGAMITVEHYSILK